MLTTRLGVVAVAWDGLGGSLVPMPNDLAYVTVEMQNPLAPGWTAIGTLDTAGQLLVPGLSYGADRQFRLVAGDRSGNTSARWPWPTIQAVRLVAGDARSPTNPSKAQVSGTKKNPWRRNVPPRQGNRRRHVHHPLLLTS
ncbi:hypothetical protein J5X84_39195 [Streptosporangiaceae bacterium NEAU-GS5]|nr:hypothetical protein [Streptosporangiaceae bacterium NEAU-GS5]